MRLLAQKPYPVPHPEQTASVLSLILYNFMGNIVFRAYRLPHLPFDELPPLADYGAAENLLQRSFKVYIPSASLVNALSVDAVYYIDTRAGDPSR